MQKAEFKLHLTKYMGIAPLAAFIMYEKHVEQATHSTIANYENLFRRCSRLLKQHGKLYIGPNNLIRILQQEIDATGNTLSSTTVNLWG